MNKALPAILATLATLIAAPAVAQNGQGILMRALDEPVDLAIADSPIVEALRIILDRTGVPVDLTDEALEALPHGEQTRLRLTARNVPLRDALSAMLAPVSLKWQVADNRIIITPSEPLARIARRPTFAELKVLHVLAETTLTADRPVIDQLRQASGISDLGFFWQVDDARQQQAIARGQAALPAKAFDYLRALTRGPELTWHVWGNEIVILPSEMQTVRQLARRVSLQYQNQPLLTILTDLVRKADLTLEMEPGALSYLPAETRNNFTLLMADSTVDQALQAISGATGLEFQPGHLSIRATVSPVLREAAATQPARPRISFIVMTSIVGQDGLEYRVMFRPDDLPPQLVEEIEARRLEIINNLRSAYGLEVVESPE